MTGITDHYILFLRNSSKLSEEFLKLSMEFKKWGVSLVPVTAEELPSLATGKRQFLIALNKDLASKKSFEKLRAKYLDFALQKKVFSLFDVSSFSKISISYRLEKHGGYFHHPLPISIEKICEMIVVEYFHRAKDTKKWPGGKRAKLPEMGS